MNIFLRFLKINKLINKQKELEFVLIQSCNEREKQVKLIEELSNKYLIMENEKNEMEQLVNNFIKHHLI